MKKGINKVILVGNLGNSPEIKPASNGGSITIISLATGESWKDKSSGDTKTKTEWHRVVLFGKLAEIAGQYLKKGDQVYFEGKLQTSKWKDQSGQDRYTTEVVVDSFDGVMQMLRSKNQNETQQTKNNFNMGDYGNNTNTMSASGGFDSSVPFDENMDDKIPF